MKDISNIIKNNYYMNNTKLEHDFNEALKNKQFNKLISNLDFSHKYLMKYTTKLEECTKEKQNCQTCKGLNECKNSYCGYIYSPEKLSNNLILTMFLVGIKKKKYNIINIKKIFICSKYLEK